MNNLEPSVQRIAELQQLIADFSNVQRALNLVDTGRRENDVEHSFGLALSCWFIAEKVAPELDSAKILKYALAHDLVELYSGDTFVFDEEMVRTKQSRETAALVRLEKEWPDFSDMIDHIRGYAEKRDAEAKFVYTIDKLLPPLHVNIGEGKDFWKRNKITRDMHEAEKTKKMQESPEAFPYLEALKDWLRNPDLFYKSDD